MITKSSPKKNILSPAELQEKTRKEREITIRSKKLLARLSVRPNERQSLIEYSELAYAQKQYECAAEYAERIIKMDESRGTPPAALYIRKGKALFRAWEQNGDYSLLKRALEGYRNAMLDHHVARNRQCYFELATIQYRLGDYQNALDTFGAAMVLFHGDIKNREHDDNTDWMYIAQYSIAHIMFLAGKSDEARALYMELMLTPMKLKVDPGPDSIISIPLRFTNIGITLEIALIMKRNKVEHTLALNLLRETWLRMDKFHKNFEDYSEERGLMKTIVDETKESFHGFNASKVNDIDTPKTKGDKHNLSDMIDGLNDFIDFRFGMKSFEEWIVNSDVMKKIGDYFKSEYNMVFAAEWYGFAGELCGGYDNLKTIAEKRYLCDVVLLRGECLATLGDFNASEHCAHFVFKYRPSDMACVMRCARCCRKHIPENEEIFAQMLKVTYLMTLIRGCIRARTVARRQKAARRLYKAATSINSFFRMVLMRNRMAGEVASAMGIIHATHRARRLLKNHQVLRSGHEALQNWFQIWNPSATALQHACMSWYYKRRFGAFRRGLKQLKGIGLGMLARSRLRRQVASIQQELDLLPDADTRCMIQLELAHHFEEGKKSKNFADISLYVDICRKPLLRLTAGVRTVTGVTAEDNYNNKTDVSFASPELTIQHSRGVGVLSEPSYGSPLKFKQRIFRRTANQVGGDNGAVWFVDNVVPDFIQPAMASKSLSISDMNMSAPSDHPPGLPAFGLPDGSPNRFTHVLGSTLEQNSISERIDIRNGSNWLHSSHNKVNFPAFVPRTIQELEEYLARAPEEDVLSIVSRRSLLSDPTAQWIPFSVLPDPSIARLLCCSLLTITSPSFCLLDALRVKHVVEASSNRLWANLRGLSLIECTRITAEGLLILLRLPAPSLKSLSVTGSGVYGQTYRIAAFLGRSLAGVKSPYEVPRSVFNQNSLMRNFTLKNLTKIIFEDEPSLGDRGVIDLLKYLQYNGMIEHLVFVRCRLTERTSSQILKYLGTSASIRTINLNGNLLHYAAVLSLVRAIGSMGNRGQFRSMKVCNMEPALTLQDCIKLKEKALEFNGSLRIDAPMIMATMESADYLRKQLEIEDVSFVNVDRSFDEMVEGNRALGLGNFGNERLAMTAFLKTIYL